MRMFALVVLAALAASPARALEEKFVVNAQYRNGINKNFKDLGRGIVKYDKADDGRFRVIISGSMKNPENAEIYKMKVSGEFALKGRAITRIKQSVEMNEEARRYESLMTENLPFVFLARFQSLPASQDAEEITYQYEGRAYRFRYVPVENAVEGTLYQGETMIGKFFLEGKFGQAPRALTKARLIGPNHLVFSLVIDTRPAEAGE